MKFDIDPFRTSTVALSSLTRTVIIAAVITALWIAIVWAVDLP